MQRALTHDGSTSPKAIAYNLAVEETMEARTRGSAKKHAKIVDNLPPLTEQALDGYDDRAVQRTSAANSAPKLLGYLLGLMVYADWRVNFTLIAVKLLLRASRAWQIVVFNMLALCMELWVVTTLCRKAVFLQQKSTKLLPSWQPAWFGCSAPLGGPGSGSVARYGWIPQGEPSGWRFSRGSSHTVGSGSDQNRDEGGSGDGNGQNPTMHKEAPGPSLSKQQGRFCCIWHHTEEFQHDGNCAKLAGYVSKLRRHHEKHHFFYCLICLRSFDTLEARKCHEPCGNFKCITSDCQNYGKCPAITRRECNSHARNQNSQEDLYRGLCCLARRRFGLVFTTTAFDISSLSDHSDNEDEGADTSDEHAMSMDDAPPAPEHAAPGPRSLLSATALSSWQHATVAQLAGRIASLSPLLQRLQARDTEMTDTEHYAIQATVTSIDQCHQQLARRLAQTTSRRSADTLADIITSRQAQDSGAKAPYASQASRGYHSSQVSSSPAPFPGQVGEPQSAEGFLQGTGARFPGHIPHAPLPSTLLPHAGFSDAPREPQESFEYNGDAFQDEWPDGSMSMYEDFEV